MPFNFRLSSVDPASSDSIRITSNVNSIIPGAAFSVNTALQQTADITWTPTATDVRATPYIFTLTLTDNSVPGGKQYLYTVKLRVSNVMGKGKEVFNSNAFTAFPNPFTESINFKLDPNTKAETIRIYNLLGQQLDQIKLDNSSLGGQQIAWEKANRLPKGTYLARLIYADKTEQVLKFTRQ